MIALQRLLPVLLLAAAPGAESLVAQPAGTFIGEGLGRPLDSGN